MKTALKTALLSWPAPYHGNPYLSRLTAALEARGVHCVSHRYLAGLAVTRLPLQSRARWLHVHWPEWMLQDKDPLIARARGLWFFALIDSFRARGIKVLWTAHNLIGHDDPHPELALQFRRQWLARCSAVLGHFASAEQSVRDLGFSGRFLLAPHPHSADDYHATATRAQLRQRWNFGPDTTALVGFGAIEHYKGFDRLIQAFRKHASSKDQLVIAGAARKAKELQALIDCTDSDRRVHLRPWHHSREESADLLTAADALALAYRQIFTSGTAMLSLTMGTPIMGPSVHHLASMANERFFFSMPQLDAELSSFAPALAQLKTALAHDGNVLREQAQQWAMQWTYEDMACKIAELVESE